MRVGAHPALAGRREVADGLDRAPAFVKEFLGPVAAEPSFELGQMLGVGADLGQRDLVGPERPLDGESVDHFGSGPALRSPQDQHGPGRSMAAAMQTSGRLACLGISAKTSSSASAMRWWTSMGLSPSKPPSTSTGR